EVHCAGHDLEDLDGPARDRGIQLVAEVHALEPAGGEVGAGELGRLLEHPLAGRVPAVGADPPSPVHEVRPGGVGAGHRGGVVGVDGGGVGLGVVEVLGRLVDEPGGAGADGEGVDDRQAHRGGAGGGDTGGGAQRGGHAAGPAPDDAAVERGGGC